MKVNLVSLGCAKNLVDSEVMLGRLEEAGWTIIADPEEADVVVVNTCSFIEAAINESIDTILELAKFKTGGSCRRLIVTGCLPERFKKDISKALPEVDLFLGTGAFDKIVPAVEDTRILERCLLPAPDLKHFAEKSTPRLRTCAHMAYLKIAEGCNRRCTYCIIPRLRGRQKSRPIDSVLAEARVLIDAGVKEMILVAQDTTAYGKDLLPAGDLSSLLKRIAGLSDKVWLRFLYGHPESIDEGVIRTVAEHDNICSYFDIPIQHASTNVLKKMGRQHSYHDLLNLFSGIRSLVADASLRTTVLVGFPGETENDFEALLKFIEEVCFDHLGVFIYSDFEDLASHHLSNHIPGQVAKERHDRLMACQAKIVMENNRKHLDKICKVLVEEQVEENLFAGRTFFQAPDVDGVTYIDSSKLEIGSFARVRIKRVLDYDLTGEIV